MSSRHSTKTRVRFGIPVPTPKNALVGINLGELRWCPKGGRFPDYHCSKRGCSFELSRSFGLFGKLTKEKGYSVHLLELEKNQVGGYSMAKRCGTYLV
jgi:hypothetical protein